MVRYLLSMLLTIWVTVTLAFFALRVLPGDAITAQLAQSGASLIEIQQMRARMGLDAPVIEQYIRYLSGLVRGDLGYSLWSLQPVSQMILARLMPTITLAAGALLVAITIGINLGIAAGFEVRASVVSRLLINLSISTPIYWTGTLAIIVFSGYLGWPPSTGTGHIESLILPVMVLSFHTMGEIARVTQVNVREVRQAAFVQMARGKGLPERYIAGRHILRVGLIPVITVIALQAGFLFSGTVITETLFVRPGVGRLLLDSTLRQDYPVVQGILILSAAFYVTANMLADFAHRLIDPRLRF